MTDSSVPVAPSPSDRAFRLKSGAEVRAGWLARDLPFMSRSLRYLLRGEVDTVRRDFGLENGDISVLAVVAANPGVTQNDVSAALVLKKSAVTRVVQRLESQGLLRRRRCPSDRRANLLTLTDDGLQLAEALRAAIERRHQNWFARIDDDEGAVFFDVLFRLVDHMTATLGGALPEGAVDD